MSYLQLHSAPLRDQCARHYDRLATRTYGTLQMTTAHQQAHGAISSVYRTVLTCLRLAVLPLGFEVLPQEQEQGGFNLGDLLEVGHGRWLSSMPLH